MADVPEIKSQSVKDVLSNRDTYASVLLVIIVDLYGLEATQWTAETIRMELEEDFNIKVPTCNIDKIMAAINVLTSDDFYKRAGRFIQICNIFSDSQFEPGVFDPPDSFEIAWGITEAILISPPEEDEPFSNEIRGFIASMLKQDGIVYPPDVLAVALSDDQGDPLASYADDPEMYSAMYDVQMSRTEELQAMLKAQLKELITVLSTLTLQNGDTKELVTRLSQGL